MSNPDTPSDSPKPKKPKRASKKRKRAPKLIRLSPEKASELIADVAFLAPGETVGTVCKRYGVSEKTLQRLKKRAAADPKWAETVQNKKLGRAQGWRDSRVRFLRNGIDKLEQLVKEAGVAQMRDVAGAIKIVGDLESLSVALGVDDVQQPVGDRQGSIPTKASSGGGREEETSESDPVH